jgi:hypothetical protein
LQIGGGVQVRTLPSDDRVVTRSNMGTEFLCLNFKLGICPVCSTQKFRPHIATSHNPIIAWKRPDLHTAADLQVRRDF